MPDDRDIAAAIFAATGKKSQIAAQRAIAGGSIHHSRCVTLEDGRRFFVKTHPASHRYPGIFEAEMLGLQRLREADAVRTPRPVAAGESFIVMEYIAPGHPAPDWAASLGRALARLHQNTQQAKFGFDRDNYLGTTAQINTWHDDWPQFWRENRLRRQLALYAKQVAAADPLLSLGEKLAAQLDDILAPCDEPAALLHGDLWSGNAGADSNGAPVIFDPACYYGQREAEIGMMRMFGGFGKACEDAYNEVWPLQAGSERRIALYRLYHELNHLNLFGQAYYASCLATLKALV